MSRYLAIDWDQNHLHVVAATVRNGKVKMERAAEWQLETSPAGGNPEELGKLLRERLKQIGIAPAPVLVSLSRDRVILKDIRYPAVPESEEADVVRFQAVKELTDAADEVLIDYVPMGERGASEQRALVLVARKDVINGYHALCQAAGLRLAAVTPRAFGAGAALRRAMSVDRTATPPPEPEQAAIAVVTLGEKWTEFSVLRGEMLVLARSLAAGPTLAAEIRRNLTVYNGQAPRDQVQAIYLSTGCDPTLRKRLADLVEIPIRPFEPFAGFELEVAGNPGGFAGAVGLILAIGEHGRVPVNFLEPRKAIPPSKPYNLRIIAAASVALIAIVGLFVAGRIAIAAMGRELPIVTAEAAGIDKRNNATKEEIKREKELGEWTAVVWPDELWDLATRIRSIEDLNVTHITGRWLAPESPPGKTGQKAEQIYAAELKVVGFVLDRRKDREPLDALIAQFSNEKDRDYYLIEGPKWTGGEGRDRIPFEFIIKIKKRPPGTYTRKLPK